MHKVTEMLSDSANNTHLVNDNEDYTQVFLNPEPVLSGSLLCKFLYGECVRTSTPYKVIKFEVIVSSV